MKLISWNVNGLRAVMNKGFNDFFESIDADIFCIQETKLQEGQIDYKPDGYFIYWNSAVKKGYSGTAVFSKIKPKKVTYGINIEEHDQEGRVITLEFEKFYLVNCYTPNSQRELTRLEYRMKWENDFREYLKKLNTKLLVGITVEKNSEIGVDTATITSESPISSARSNSDISLFPQYAPALVAACPFSASVCFAILSS